MKHFKFTLLLTILMSVVGMTTKATTARYYTVTSTDYYNNYSYFYINGVKLKFYTGSNGTISSTVDNKSLTGDIIIPDTLIDENGNIYKYSFKFIASDVFKNVTSIKFGKIVNKVSIASACPLIKTLNIPNYIKELHVTDMAG